MILNAHNSLSTRASRDLLFQTLLAVVVNWLLVTGIVLVTSVVGPRVLLELVLVRVGRGLIEGLSVVGLGAVVVVGRLGIGCGVRWLHVVRVCWTIRCGV